MDKREKILSLISNISQVDDYLFNQLNDEKPPLSRDKAEEFIYDLQGLLFPSMFPSSSGSFECILKIYDFLSEVTHKDPFVFLNRIPEIKRQLISDISAIYAGDPAATSVEEIVLAYPGFFATEVYRLSHILHVEGVRFLPRLMSEIAHEKTGIDIHPGAIIGERFCIDHGTGVVIGETAVIGSRVKIYQGVTIGAKSFETDEDGKLIKGRKRHPDIGNDCVIYANATILGGDTKIGDGCVIGGNVWLTHSVPAGQRVYYKERN